MSLKYTEDEPQTADQAWQRVLALTRGPQSPNPGKQETIDHLTELERQAVMRKTWLQFLARPT